MQMLAVKGNRGKDKNSNILSQKQKLKKQLKANELKEITYSNLGRKHREQQGHDHRQSDRKPIYRNAQGETGNR